MGSISRSVQRVKDDLASVVPPEVILECCLKAGHTWRWRKLDPVTTILLFIKQVLHGNTSCAHVRQLAGSRFSRSAYCEARKRLPCNVLLQLVRRSGRLSVGDGLWRGRRVLGVDGSSFSTSDTPDLCRTFGYGSNQQPGCGFPSARFVALFDLVTGLLIELSAASDRIGELPLAQHLHRFLRRGDILVGDRAYCSYAHLATLANKGIDAVFRLHGAAKVSFRAHRVDCKSHSGLRTAWVRTLGKDDQIVRWKKPTRPRWIDKQAFDRLGDELVIRQIRYRTGRRGFRSQTVVLATTLLDPEAFPKASLEELYGNRWQVETNLGHLKTTMNMDVLRCTTEEGIRRELAIFGIVYNAVRLVMLHAGQAQGIPPERISFVDVLRWLCLESPGEILPRFEVNPKRDRYPEPRVVKRRPKAYPRMTWPRNSAKPLSLKGLTTN